MADNESKVPRNAIGDGGDLTQPTQELLRGLLLLPKKGANGETEKAKLLTTPDSVAVIESGATAVAKWWTAGIAGGASAAALTVRNAWDRLGEGDSWNQPFALLAVGIILAAAAGGIAYLLGSDVRGRASASTATIQARQAVAIAMISGATAVHQSSAPDPGAPADAVHPIVPLPGVAASNITQDSANEAGWVALAFRTDDKGESEVLLAKGRNLEWVASTSVDFT